MTPERCREITDRYAGLRLAVVGDFCLDRYFEIDPERGETSLETGRAVHQVTRVRSQPGAAGTVLANLSALGVGEIHAIGMCGDDGEGFELERALHRMRGVKLSRFACTAQRATFTYTKPLICRPDRPPEELERLDIKNWSSTPPNLSAMFVEALIDVASEIDGILVMDQAGADGTGVVTGEVEEALGELGSRRPDLLILADSRSATRPFPNVGLKMNAGEFARRTESEPTPETVSQVANSHGRPVYVTLADQGILGASPGHGAEHVPARPVRGETDIVGAGDAVLANLGAALAAGASPHEAMILAMAAASIVIHQLGTTGTARTADLVSAFS